LPIIGFMEKKKKSSIGCLFWIALILLVVVIVLFNLKQIDYVVKATGMDKFFNSLLNRDQQGTGTEAVTAKPEKQEPPLPKKTEEVVVIHDEPKPTSTVSPTKTIQKEPVRSTAKPTRTVTKKDEVPNVRNANLYYSKIDNEGRISFVPVKRAIRYDDSPLKSTIVNLLKGPNYQEINSGFMNLIPADTRLNNIYMRGNSVFLDFNENFRFNTLGKEGIKAQLQQIVYTCLEYKNVQSVQILIDSQLVDYMEEGVYIGKPLNKDSF